jgi:hypothetical protein
VQGTVALFGSVIDQVTPPVGIRAFGIPATVVVKVVVPPSVGLEDATTEITGVCLPKVTVEVALEIEE